MATEADPAGYFSSYGDLSVHALMLSDRPRTLAYKNFIEQNKHLFADKVVLDVGAGTGILSLFCASAGAKQVIAVEASDVADVCSQIVKCNKMEDKITVIKGQIEAVELPVEKVDVIVSEWMGFYLLHESMLDSVIFARDKWLSPTGVMVPAIATLYVAPVNMSSYVNENFRVWEKAYGYDFSPFQTATMTSTAQQPVITCINSSQLLAEAQSVIELDLKTVTIYEVQNIEKVITFELAKSGLLHAFSLWFDVHFTAPPENCRKDRVQVSTLSSSPFVEDTHWKQTVIFIPMSASLDEGENISCKLELGQDKTNKRHYNISIETLADGIEEDSGTEDQSDISEEEDVSGHPTPCDCSSARCRLIRALVERYDQEAECLEQEAEDVEVKAEVEAANTVDREVMEEGGIVGDSP